MWFLQSFSVSINRIWRLVLLLSDVSIDVDEDSVSMNRLEYFIDWLNIDDAYGFYGDVDTVSSFFVVAMILALAGHV